MQKSPIAIMKEKHNKLRRKAFLGNDKVVHRVVSMLERGRARQVDFTHSAVRQTNILTVAAAHWLPVAGKVLGNGNHPLSLDPLIQATPE